MSPDDTALFQSASVTRRRPSLLKDLAKLARVTREFPRFLRTPITVGDAAETIKQRLATRALRFIALARRAIYANSRSPYLPLLRAAGCELGDLEALVAADGLEGALTKLAQAGVYLTFDEFKGRKQIIRGSLRMICNEDDFDNPGIVPHIEAWSGGTRSPGTSVKLSLSYFLDLAINTAITLEMQGMSEYDHAVWLQGFTPGFIYAKLGRPVLAWFYPVGPPAPAPASSRYTRSWWAGELARRPSQRRQSRVSHNLRQLGRPHLCGGPRERNQFGRNLLHYPGRTLHRSQATNRRGRRGPSPRSLRLHRG